MSKRRESKGPARPRWALWAGLIAMAALVIGAAFVGGRLFGTKQPIHARRPIMVTERPKELPDRPPTTIGIITHIEGKIITIEKPNPGSGEAIAPLIRGREGNETEEIVVTQETAIYRDKPIKPEPGEKLPPGEVEKIELADLRVDEVIFVWGEKHGDRVVAEVIYAVGQAVTQ